MRVASRSLLICSKIDKGKSNNGRDDDDDGENESNSNTNLWVYEVTAITQRSCYHQMSLIAKICACKYLRPMWVIKQAALLLHCILAYITIVIL